MVVKWTVVAWMGLALVLGGCAGDTIPPGTDTEDISQGTDTPGTDSASPSDDTTIQDSGSAKDTVDTSGPPPLPPAPPYDFAAQAPWYSCGPDSLPNEVVMVNGFYKEDQYFGAENKRQVEIDVEFPESGSWAQVGLFFQLECPENGLCDHWDRSGSIQLILNPDDEPESHQVVEVARQITPYRTGMCQYIDITELAPLLKGKKRLTSWIDTWVGPGHNQGEGWRVTTRFVFYPGEDAAPAEVINIWSRRSITVGEVEPDKNVDSQIEPVTFTVPEGTTKVMAHLITTGHSFGNTGNCAEFCPMRHDVIINGTPYSANPWRDDCAANPVSNQAGTWKYPRNGWCPGAIAVGDKLDITASVLPGQDNTLDFNILLANGQEYDNLAPVDLLPNTLVSLKLYVYK
jgi:hypothetical protein